MSKFFFLSEKVESEEVEEEEMLTKFFYDQASGSH